MPLTATGMRVVMRQLAEIDANPIDGIRVHPSDDLSELRFDLDGPEGTPFSEGRFHVALVFDEAYPEVPPKGYFRTKIFHPNVSDRGDICVNALKKDWSPQLGLRHVLVVIRCLLIEPNPESALNEEAGRLLLEDYADYERKARMLTNVHARRPANALRIAHEASNTENSIHGAAGPTSSSGGATDQTPTHGAVSEEGGPQSAGRVVDAGASGAGPLRSLEGNARASTATGGKKDGMGGEGGATTSSNDAATAAEKAKKKAAEKKKNALRRI